MNMTPGIPETILPGFNALVRSFPAPKKTAPGVLVALSGGPDSVALLRLALLWAGKHGGQVEAAHFNHGLRGEASVADQTFCSELCDRYSVPLHLGSGDTNAEAANRGRGLEDAARQMRLDFFTGLLNKQHRLICCATGHHRDDRVETIVMRMFRGTGLDGLAGIRPRAGRMIHPLLPVSRREILDWLAELGQDHRIDQTNLDRDNTRAGVRNHLLPLARELFGHGCERSLLRLGDLAARDNSFLDDVTGESLAMCRAEDGGDGLIIEDLLALHPVIATRVLRKHLHDLPDFEGDLEAAHINRLLDWLPESKSSGKCDLTGSWQAVRRFSVLDFKPSGTDTAPRAQFELDIKVASESEFSDFSPESGNIPEPGAVYSLTCPTANIQGDIRLRHWQEGDVIVPFGMQGHRKVSEVLRDMKVNVADRHNILIVEDDAGILWIVDFMRAEKTRLLPSIEPGITIRVHGTQG
jgi:tRNA(Ile)-lysidine synthase